MSDVTLIQDEDVLRKMWQQTEDFSKKREIRAHMYKLREERLKDLYTSATNETHNSLTKGEEFSSSREHSKLFADQSFQSIKSKEVRDAGSPPPREYEIKLHVQDLKDKADAGWTVDSKSEITDGGHTKINSSNATIAGNFDTEHGRGKFSAQEQQKFSTTDYSDDRRKFHEDVKNKAASAHEEVVEQTANGISKQTSTKSAQSYHQKSTNVTTDEVDRSALSDFGAVEREINDLNNIKQSNRLQARQSADQIHSSLLTSKNLKDSIDYQKGELVSRKIEYPDSNTKVVVETRTLPDGSIVTSRKTEIRDAKTETRAEKHSNFVKEVSSNTESHVSQKDIAVENSQKSFLKNSLHDEASRDFVESQRLIQDSSNLDFVNASENVFNNIKESSLFNKLDSVHRNNNFVNEHTQLNTENQKTFSPTFTSEKNIKIDIETGFSNKHSENFSQNIDVQNERYFNSAVDTDRYRFDSSDDFSKTDKNVNIRTQTDNFTDDITKKSFKQTQKDMKNDAKTYQNENESNHQTSFHSDNSNRITTDYTPGVQEWAKSLRHDSPPRSHYPRSNGTSTTSLRRSSSPDKSFSSRGASPFKKDHSVSKDSRTTASSEKKYFERKSPSPTRKSNQTSRFVKTEDNYECKTKQPKHVNDNTESYSNTHLKQSSPRTTNNLSNLYKTEKQSPSPKSFEYSPKTSPSKHSNVTDFITTEKSEEETLRCNTKVTNKNKTTNPRTLTTPSSSPTRKINQDTYSNDTSPTTSVSDIAYFSSKIETKKKDEEYFERPKSLNIGKPAKQTDSPNSSPSGESQPRKGSLKKPSITTSSPSIKNSPNEVQPKISTLKDKSSGDTPNKVSQKIKPPLVRTETYEERCKKILGIDKNEDTVSTTTEDKTSEELTRKSLHMSNIDLDTNSEEEIKVLGSDSTKAENIHIDITINKTNEKTKPIFFEEKIKTVIESDVASDSSDFLKNEKISSERDQKTVIDKKSNDNKNFDKQKITTQIYNKNSLDNNKSKQDLNEKRSISTTVINNAETTSSKQIKEKNFTNDNNQELEKVTQKSTHISRVDKKDTPQTPSVKNKTANQTKASTSPTFVPDKSKTKDTDFHNTIKSNNKNTTSPVKETPITDAFKSTPSKNANSKNPKIEIPKTQDTTQKTGSRKSSLEEEMDILIEDVEHAKSAGNSPDRICPTPVSFDEIDDKPRLPDDVSEPEEDKSRRIHHTILEDETFEEDIIEMSDDEDEDEDIGIKKSIKVEEVIDEDVCLLSVNEKVTKFTAVSDDVKTKSTQFHDVEKDLHSDFTKLSDKVKLFSDNNNTTKADKSEINIKECGVLKQNEDKRTNDVKTKSSQFYNVEKDQHSDFTKISDKVKLFPANENTTKAVKVEISIKECDISKQNEEKRKVKPQNLTSLFNKVKNAETKEESTILKEENTTKNGETKNNSFAKKTESWQAKIKDTPSHTKTVEKPKTPKLFSNESVKKTKELFEKITKTEDSTKKSIRLTDIGVQNKTNQTNELDLLTPKEKIVSVKPKQDSTKPDQPELIKGTNTLTKECKNQSNIDFIETEREVSTRRGSGKFGVELRRTSLEGTTADRRKSSVTENKTESCIEETEDIKLLEQWLESGVPYETRRRIRAQIRLLNKKKQEIEANKSITKIRSQLSPEKNKRNSDRLHIKDKISKHDLKEESKKVSKYEDTDNWEQSLRSDSPKRKSPEKIITEHIEISVSVKKPSLRAESPIKQKSPERVDVKTKIEVKDLKNQSISSTSKINSDKTTAYAKTEKRDSTHKFMFNKDRTNSAKRLESLDEKRSPSLPKTGPTDKNDRFNEYATAYVKKVGSDTVKNEHKNSSETRIKTTSEKNVKQVFSTGKIAEKQKQTATPDRQPRFSPSPTKITKDEADSKTTVHQRTISVEKQKQTASPDRQPRSPSPIKRMNEDVETKTKVNQRKSSVEKLTKTTNDKPTWVTNNGLRKTVLSEVKTIFSRKKEPEKPKYRSASPTKTVSKPLDVITSSYGVGPVDTDGKPLFGIKALRNGSTKYQVKGTVVREEYHSTNGSAPEGQISVTAYSTNPLDLEKILSEQRLGESDVRKSSFHGLSAITSTKRISGESKKMERKAIEDKKISETTESMKSLDSKTYKRQGSVKSITEKFIKNAVESNKIEKEHYPKAGLIFRSTSLKDSEDELLSPDIGQGDNFTEFTTTRITGPGMEHTSTTQKSVKSSEQTRQSNGKVINSSQKSSQKTVKSSESRQSSESSRMSHQTTRPSHETSRVSHETSRVSPVSSRLSHDRSTTRDSSQSSFLDSRTKVTGVKDILTRMKNADIVIEDTDTNEDAEARSLLNKFLGATVLMAGMKNYVVDSSANRTSSTARTERRIYEVEQLEDDLEAIWDEKILYKLLENCTDYERRRQIRTRLRQLMAEKEACEAVSTAVKDAGEDQTDAGKEGTAVSREEVTIKSSISRDSNEKSVTESKTTKTTKVSGSVTKPAAKPVSPFDKFKQLEKQNSTSSPSSPVSPKSPTVGNKPMFKFTDPALAASAATIKDRLLQWCRDKTRDYENVKLENFSTSWSDGLAFCALIHHFLPNAFDYSELTADKRRYNFTLAFKVADEKAGIYPLLDVDDMVSMRKPDWKCVFTYVQAIHRRFKDEI